GSAAAPRPWRPADHARSWRRGRNGRSRCRHVRRTDRRARTGRGALRESEAPVYAWIARIDSRPDPGGTVAGHPGDRAGARHPAARLFVRHAVPRPIRTLREGASRGYGDGPPLGPTLGQVLSSRTCCRIRGAEMTPLLQVRHLVKDFTRRRGLFGSAPAVRAVDDISFDIAEGETFGLVGESGSGKTTTGRCILRLVEPTSGEIRFRGEDVLGFSKRRMRDARRQMQVVFQDPYSSLNPRVRVGDIVEEPLAIHRLGTVAERKSRVKELFELVGLD